MTVVERRKTKLAVKLFLEEACCVCAAPVTEGANVVLFPVMFKVSAFMACRDTEGYTVVMGERVISQVFNSCLCPFGSSFFCQGHCADHILRGLFVSFLG